MCSFLSISLFCYSSFIIMATLHKWVFFLSLFSFLFHPAPVFSSSQRDSGSCRLSVWMQTVGEEGAAPAIWAWLTSRRWSTRAAWLWCQWPWKPQLSAVAQHVNTSTRAALSIPETPATMEESVWTRKVDTGEKVQVFLWKLFWMTLFHFTYGEKVNATAVGCLQQASFSSL